MNYRLIYKLLHDSEAIRNRVGTRIYAENAPASTQGECIIIRNLSGSVNSGVFGESDCAQPMVQIDFYAENATKAHSGYECVRNRLSGMPPSDIDVLNDAGIEEDIHVNSCVLRRPGMLVEEPRDGSDRWSYRYSADFELFHSQSVPTHV